MVSSSVLGLEGDGGAVLLGVLGFAVVLDVSHKALVVVSLVVYL